MRRVIQKLKFWCFSDRIGPDLPLTHFLLYFKGAGRWLAARKLNAFGDGAEIRPHAFLVETKHISIGSNVVIRSGCKLFAVPDMQNRGQIIIDDNVLIGSDVHIYTANHSFSEPNTDIFYQGHDIPKKVHIKKGAWIGARVIILPGVTIGQNAVVGAGSVVTKDVTDFSIAVGSPARTIKRIKTEP